MKASISGPLLQSRRRYSAWGWLLRNGERSLSVPHLETSIESPPPHLKCRGSCYVVKMSMSPKVGDTHFKCVSFVIIIITAKML